MFGNPETIRSDNGPPFNSQKFAEFCKDRGIHHRKITPLWPEANGIVERFMRTLSKIIRTAAIEKKDWKEEVETFLANYRLTPHPATGVSPADLMFRHSPRNLLPELKRRDMLYNFKLKAYADKRRGVCVPGLKTGDQVLLKRHTKLLNKAESRYELEPYRVVRVKGSCITAVNSKSTVCRNSSYFKKTSSNVPHLGGSQPFTSKLMRQQIEQPRSLPGSSAARLPPQGPTLLAHSPATANPPPSPSRAGSVSRQQSPRPPRCTQAVHLQPETAAEMAVSDDLNRVEGSCEPEEPGSLPEAAHQPGTAAPDSPSSEDGFHGFEGPEPSQVGGAERNAVVTRSGRTSRRPGHLTENFV